MEVEKLKLRYSHQSLAVLEHLKDFDIDDFEKWVEANKFVVGSKWIIEYLETKEKNNKIFRGEKNDR